jgi:hypothetical protein
MTENHCVICGNVYEGHGHNPSPIKEEGRCCEACNAIHVIPLRISRFTLRGGDHPLP